MSPVFSRAEMRLGLAAVAASAILFSAKAVFIKMGYTFGVEPVVFMAMRMLYCLPFFAGMALAPWLRGKAAPSPMDRRDILTVAALGILGYYLASLFDLIGLQYVTAGMERMILYVYPTLVILFSAWIFRKPMGSAMILPLVLSYAGIAVSFGAETFGNHGSNPQLGALLIFLSAVCYALFLVIQGRIINRVGPQRLTAYAMLFSTGAVLIHFILAHSLSDLEQPLRVHLLAAAVAVFSTVMPAYLLGFGIHRVGAGRAAVVSSVGPASTFVLAALLLGERAGWMQVLGLVLVGGGGLRLGMAKGGSSGAVDPVKVPTPCNRNS